MDSDSFLKPICMANAVARSPTNSVCCVFSRTCRATPIAFFMFRIEPTAPMFIVFPSMISASSATSAFSSGLPP